MKNNNHTYKILAHGKFPQIRLGFEAAVAQLPFEVKIHYADFSADGLMSHLRKVKPDLLVILLNEGDSEFCMPLKVKLFAASDIPLLLILPTVPDRYFHALKMVGVDRVIQLPISEEEVCKEISDLLSVVK